MNRNILIGLIVLAVTSSGWGAGKLAHEIIKTGDEVMRGKTSISRMKIIVERPRYKRSIVLDAWDESGKDRFFLRIAEPAKDRGVTFLKAGKNMVWQYIPKIGKEIKIEASLMFDSWMGSDFTNDDLVKQSSVIHDYVHTFLPEENPQQYKIQLIPKPGSAVVWSKIIIHVRKDLSLPVREDFYDHKGRIKKKMILEDFRTMDGRVIPVKITMFTLENNRPVSKTILQYQKIQFNRDIPEQVFSQNNLRK